MTGKYVETRAFRKALGKYGFRYVPTSHSLILSYPYLPKKFDKDAVRVQLSELTISPVSQIGQIEYFKKGMSYNTVERPEENFQNYVEDILSKCYVISHPKYMLC